MGASAGDCAWALASLEAALLHVDEHGVIVSASEAAPALLDRRPEELAGAAVDAVLMPATKLAECARAGPDARPLEELEVRLADGRRLFLRVIVRPRGSGYVVLFQEETRWRSLRDERDRLLQLATVGDIMPTLLHEIKNPLAAVITSLELMIEDVPSGQHQQELHAILSELRRVPLVLDGVGAVGRPLRADFPQAVDHAIREAIQVVAGRARSAGVLIACDVPFLPLLPLNVSTLRAVLFNLVTNAVHACTPTRGHVEVTARLVDDGGELELVVEDTGTGMSDETLRRCRQLFFTTKSSGTGIGLALCNDTVRAAGGALDIESTPGVGTTVRVRIPLAPTPAAASQP